MMHMFSGASSGGWFEKAQRFGKSFMLPIAVLPAAGLLLGIGGALSNPNTLTAYPFLNVGWLQAIFTIMSSAGLDCVRQPLGPVRSRGGGRAG
ncbi:PTS system glucose-specific enzyme II, ABC component [Atlantibacter hermannii]|nr:PTS system glucose-specific enzyme II, ABC component [Atlantibacter hermannii]